MYDKNMIFHSSKEKHQLHPTTCREWLERFRQVHPIAKRIMLQYPFASYGEWEEKYYNHPSIRKKLKQILEKR
jgi:hypothetical protein